MTPFEKKVCAFCNRHKLNYWWRNLQWNGLQAVVQTMDSQHHSIVRDKTRRLKNVRITDWTRSDGGVWDGYVYLQDAADAERVEALTMAEAMRNENWWQVYHDCIEKGMDKTEASRHAEDLYPTPISH